MRNIKLTIEYDGTDFGGWQIQPNARTVQEVLKEAIRKITGEEVTVHGSGRTDSGVHACAQVANFQTASALSAEVLQRAINSCLPPDVAILAAEDVPENFHARYSALGKTYRYLIHNDAVRTALYRRTRVFVPTPLDLSAMKAAAEVLVGEHDFASFGLRLESEDDTVRKIFAFTVDSSENGLEIKVTGSGFLRGMVRSLVGTLLEVGRGKIAVADVRQIMESRNRDCAGPTAPPHGLCLLRVYYEPGFEGLQA